MPDQHSPQELNWEPVKLMRFRDGSLVVATGDQSTNAPNVERYVPDGLQAREADLEKERDRTNRAEELREYWMHRANDLERQNKRSEERAADDLAALRKGLQDEVDRLRAKSEANRSMVHWAHADRLQELLDSSGGENDGA